MLPPAFRYDIFRNCASVPLWPTPVVHPHTWMSNLMSCKCHVPRSHSRTAQNTNGASEINASTSEEIVELLLGKEVTRRRQEQVEWKANGAWDVAWLCVCQSQTENMLLDLHTFFYHLTVFSMHTNQNLHIYIRH